MAISKWAKKRYGIKSVKRKKKKKQTNWRLNY